jgi:hypothetical protein
VCRISIGSLEPDPDLEERQKRPVKRKNEEKFIILKVGCVLWMTGGFSSSVKKKFEAVVC